MYTVVLMAALTTAPAAPDFGHHRCSGCTGCSGCSGYGCSGCYGGGYGAGCAGYTGIGYTCRGYGGWGTHWGMGHGGYYTGYGCTGCYGCYGGYSCYGVPIPAGVTYISPGMGSPAPITPPVEVTPAPKKKGNEQTRAKVRIELPEDAKLYVDGQLMKTSSAVRLFQTPELQPGQTYYYEVRAEVTRNNQTVTDAQQIVVRSGEMTTLSFATLEQRAAAVAATAQR